MDTCVTSRHVVRLNTTTYDICRSCEDVTEDVTEELSVKHLLCVCSRLS